jgi:hypothetical protein
MAILLRRMKTWRLVRSDFLLYQQAGQLIQRLGNGKHFLRGDLADGLLRR